MSRRLVLLRHGRTAWNEAGRTQGHADIELDATGHAQARAVAAYLAGFDVVALWSSDLARARQTADHLAAALRLPVVTDERLREFDVGDRQGLTLAEFADRFPEDHAEWAESGGVMPARGGELTVEVEKRIVPALRDCLDRLGPGECGLVVTHGAALKVAVAGLLDWPPELAASLAVVDNCAWATLEEVAHRGRLRLAGYNQNCPPEAPSAGG